MSFIGEALLNTKSRILVVIQRDERTDRSGCRRRMWRFVVAMQ